jgi:hypothetical protein
MEILLGSLILPSMTMGCFMYLVGEVFWFEFLEFVPFRY